jgi:SAM-dependent methyltransferase
VARHTSYDEVPYESYPFAQTHPDRLATVATLLGLRPPRVDHCRVMELGRAGGGNLLPMAATLPESRFVGVDLSGRQMAEGQKVVEALGLENIELKHRSILDIDRDFGRFDYIICHGVYSWVPAPVQDKILEVCGQNLTPNGVAYAVSDRFDDAAAGNVGHVWKTINGGAARVNISGNLPDLPTWTIKLDPRSGALYVGTDDGVYVSKNAGVTWSRLATGLPHVQVRELELNTTLSLLAAGTHGRSAWELCVPPP